MTARGKRQAAPKPTLTEEEVLVLSPPSHLQGEAREVSKETAESLRGKLTGEDSHILESYSRAVATEREAYRQVLEEGLTIREKTKAGEYTRPHPAYAIYSQSQGAARMLRAKLGASPRDRVGLPEAKEEIVPSEGELATLLGVEL